VKSPTMDLRFIERKIDRPCPQYGKDIVETIVVRVLQQRFIDGAEDTWEDVKLMNDF